MMLAKPFRSGKCWDFLSGHIKNQLDKKLADEAAKTDVEFFSGDLDESFLEVVGEKQEMFVDTETTGLDLNVDRLCKVQIYLPAINKILLIDIKPNTPYTSFPVLRTILCLHTNTKNFHYALFDCAFLRKKLRGNVINPFCTYIASKVVKNTGDNSYNALCRDFLKVSLNKEEQRAYWGGCLTKMDNSKIEYMILDVFLLRFLKEQLFQVIIYENKSEIVQQANSLVKTIAKLKCEGFDFAKVFKL